MHEKLIESSEMFTFTNSTEEPEAPENAPQTTDELVDHLTAFKEYWSGCVPVHDIADRYLFHINNPLDGLGVSLDGAFAEVIQVFEDIEQQMACLNDFIITVFEVTSNRREGIETELDLLKEDRPEALDSSGFTNYEMRIPLEQDLSKWEWIDEFLKRATALMLIHTFVEKSMKSLVKVCIPKGLLECVPEEIFESERPKDEGPIAMDLFRLQIAGYNISESGNVLEIRKNLQKVRNAFTQGDWNEVEKLCKELSIRDAFQAATDLFNAISEAMDRENVD